MNILQHGMKIHGTGCRYLRADKYGVKKMSGKKRGKTILREILLPLLSVLIFEMLFMSAAIRLSGVTKKLNQNAADMLLQRTENKGNYLLNEMTGNWSSLDMLSDDIDDKVQSRLEQGLITLADLNGNNEKCTELLKDISPELIETMYNKQISGIFMIFNTYGLEDPQLPEMLPGIYLRDLDPKSASSERNADLLWERAPAGLVRSSYIATDSGWQPGFSRSDSVEQEFFYKPFVAAYSDIRNLKEKEYGYWTVTPYSLSGDKHAGIAYSIPLVLKDGTVYGVLGVELLTDYIQSLLSDTEFAEDKQGSYLLAVGLGEDAFLTPVIRSGDIVEMPEIEELHFVLLGDGNVAEDAEGKYYAAVKRLEIYSNHAPFDADKWYLLGIGPKKSLFAFSGQIRAVLLISIAVTFIIGLLGILYASYRLSKPIRQLSEEVAAAQKDNRMPVLSATGIIEIDQFADSISRLGQEVVESSTRFLSIMDMASVELAGYEIQKDTDSVYVTDNYFKLLGIKDINIRNLTVEEFLRQQKKLGQLYENVTTEDGSIVYSVPQDSGNIRYLRFEQQEKDGRQIGLLEDVTSSTLEKKRIEDERDSDSLTKLYARRGFKREADNLFLKPEVLKHAGLLMIDLDNLKTTNDRFGHNFGDRYIQTAGRCFVENTPENTLCARMSGDEFVVLFYGYESREEIRSKVKDLYRAIGEVKFVLPNGDNMGLSASGGVAWYPEDSNDLSELMKYADFAMYQVKRSKKGKCKEFEIEAYIERQYQNQCRLELNEALEKKDIDYFFQPIFESKKGEVYGYEALMRVNMPDLRSPELVLRLAKEEGRMHDIESITLFRATECYRTLLEKGTVEQEAFLFINSIAGECMTEEEVEKYHELYEELQSRIVVEITEAENFDMELIRKKGSVKSFSGMFALDDYGSGYSSEINLLELNPKFIKVDISIVRDMDKDAGKRRIISNIVSYAHERGMLIIAEGLETAEELKTAISLGVDLFQGYYLAKPAEIPEKISAEALEVIENCRKKN
ncbi:MAG: EAL domain-containing protein [Lachnospiraceae bacterium]|nr:EAL domain-containing protein [Lachnospiraceae bacterium]